MIAESTDKKILIFGKGKPPALPSGTSYIRLDKDDDPRFGIAQFDDDTVTMDIGKAYELFQEWSDKVFSQDGSNLRREWMYDELFSLWWCVDHRDWLVATVSLLKQTERLLSLSEKNHYSKWILSCDTEIDYLVREIAAFKNIPFEQTSQIKKKSRLLKGSLRFQAVCLYLFLSWQIRSKHVKGETSSVDLVISSISHLWGRVWDSDAQDLVPGDKLFSTILDRLQEKNINFLYIDYVSHLGMNLTTLKEKKQCYLEHYRPLESFLTLAAFRRAVRNANRYRLRYCRYRNQSKFQDIFRYRGISFWYYMERWFDLIVHQFLPFACFYVEAMECLQDKIQPKILLHAPELGFYGRIFSSISRKHGALSIGLSHAAAYHNQPSLIKRKTDIAEKNDYVGTTCCPIPDKTFVYGSKDVEYFYGEGNYPTGSVLPFGAPQYDLLVNAGQFNRTAFIKQYSIPAKKRIVVFASQPPLRVFASEKTYYEHVEAVCQELKFLTDDIFFFYKLHPMEPLAGTKYRQIIEEAGITDYLIDRDAYLFRLLALSDLVITVSSNVISDSILCNTPTMRVILSDFFGLDANLQYLVTVRDRKNLGGEIQRLLSRQYRETEMQQLRDELIEKVFNKNTGNATGKITEYLMENLEK